MNNIEKLLQELCPNGVRCKALGEVAEYIRGVTYKKSDETSNDESILPALLVVGGAVGLIGLAIYLLNKKED